MLPAERLDLLQRPRRRMNREHTAKPLLIRRPDVRLAAAHQRRRRHAQRFGPAGHAYHHLAAQALTVQPALAGDDEVGVRRLGSKVCQLQHRLNAHT